MRTRREFLEIAAALLAAPYVGVRRGVARLPLGFSTLGCPAWTWTEILNFAAAHDYAAVELRGLQATMDLTKAPDFAPERLPDVRRQLVDRGLRVSCLGASAQLHEMEPAKRAPRARTSPGACASWATTRVLRESRC